MMSILTNNTHCPDCGKLLTDKGKSMCPTCGTKLTIDNARYCANCDGIFRDNRDMSCEYCGSKHTRLIRIMLDNKANNRFILDLNQ
ncbi:MAG TPA: zinc ribbon domain-containing protein [Candidatus Absconditabacterales bacterium]|nr:zinc ribbon domain-containing protein [Candidatus Absconditabacterales bacterium]